MEWSTVGEFGERIEYEFAFNSPIPDTMLPIQYISPIFRVNLVFAPFYINYFNFDDRNVIYCLAMDMFCTIFEIISFHYTYADDLLMLMLIF